MARSIMIVGGSRGIGAEVARQFLELGDHVAVASRRGNAPEGAFGVACDVTDADQVNQAFKAVEDHQGAPEVVVANAGITRDTLLLRMSEDDFTSVLDTNLVGAYRVAKRASRAMLRARRGRLIFIGSAVGLAGEAGQANYAASKAGLVGLARSLARELGTRGITSNVVAPGLTETDMTAALTEERRAEIIHQVPLARIARPAEIASTVRFLASDDASYVTGAVIPVDGGVAMGH